MPFRPLSDIAFRGEMRLTRNNVRHRRVRKRGMHNSAALSRIRTKKRSCINLAEDQL